VNRLAHPGRPDNRLLNASGNLASLICGPIDYSRLQSDLLDI